MATEVALHLVAKEVHYKKCMKPVKAFLQTTDMHYLIVLLLTLMGISRQDK